MTAQPRKPIRFAVPTVGGRHWPGGWNYMQTLVRTLGEHGPEDIETVVFVGPEADAEARETFRTAQRTRLVVAPEFADDCVRGGLLKTVLSGRNSPVLRKFEEEGIDVAFLAAILLGWRSRVASLAWFPDFQHHGLPHLFSRKQWWRREIGMRVQSRAAQTVMLSSQDSETSCHSAYPETRSKTVVAPFAVSRRNWPTIEEARQTIAEAGLPTNYILLPNQLWLHKNHELVVKAVRQLTNQSQPLPILATGGGVEHRRVDYPGELNRAIAEGGMGERLQMLGSVPFPLLRALLTMADALLNPSRFEGWSTTVEEAKSNGLPMLLSNLPVHREQAPGARFFDPDDAAALANLISTTTPRTFDEKAVAIRKAEAGILARERLYADRLAQAIRRAHRQTGR